MEYWHLSRVPLTPGPELLKARRGEGHYAFLTLKLPGGELTVEDFFERHRPKGKPSRKSSWFMCPEVSELYHASPGGKEVEVHILGLEPDREPSRHHFGWMALVNNVAFEKVGLDREEEATLKEMAKMYWAGEECPDELLFTYCEGTYGWELLARAVRVTSCSEPMMKVYLSPFAMGLR
jgi:hypothetical protein